jgi:hypothetical protein
VATRLTVALVLAAVVAAGCSSGRPGVASIAPTAATTAPTETPGLAATTATTASPVPTAPAGGAPPTTGAPSPPPTAAPTGVPADMLNQVVTPATISTTICVSGYTTRIRPPTSFTEPLKIHQIATYRYADTQVSDYEEDHVIALEIGGAPASSVNLFPEAHRVSNTDDTLENDLHTRVCRGQLTLAGAQLQLFTAKLAHGYSRAASTA